MKSLTLAACTLLCMGFGVKGHAEYHDKNQMNAECKPSCSWCEQVPMRDECGIVPAYNAPARYNLACPWDAFGSASFIYWQARANNISGGSRDQRTTSFTATAAVPEQVSNIQFDYEYNPGFKVMLGMYFPHDNWKGSLEYTWLWFSSSMNASQDLPGHITPPLQVAHNSGILHNESLEWKLKYNALDSKLSRPYFVGTDLIVTTHVGARFVYMNNDFSLNTNDIDFGPLVEPRYMTQEIASKTTNWFLGPRAGLITDWRLGCNFTMTAETALSILYRDVSNTYVNYGNLVTRTPDVLAVDNKSDFGSIDPNIDMSLGFAWGDYFNGNSMHFDIETKYDFVYYWDGSYVYNTGSDNLVLHGLTVSAKLEF